MNPITNQEEALLLLQQLKPSESDSQKQLAYDRIENLIVLLLPKK